MTDTIVSIEWDLFQQVQNIGGRASCQDDRETFFIMRASQLDAWTPAMRKSYLADLHAAAEDGRSPLSEKYAYMMERTDPVGYARVKDALPPRSPEKLALIDFICAVHVDWLRKLSRKFPLLTGRGRNIDRSWDTPYSTSMETYLYGELSTYSLNTLLLYRDFVEQLQQAGQNLNELILRNTVLRYGYSSLEETEAHLARGTAQQEGTT